MAQLALVLLALPFLADHINTAVRDIENLQGTWVWIAAEEDGKKIPAPLGWGFKLIFRGNTYTIPALLGEEEKFAERGGLRSIRTAIQSRSQHTTTRPALS